MVDSTAAVPDGISCILGLEPKTQEKLVGPERIALSLLANQASSLLLQHGPIKIVHKLYVDLYRISDFNPTCLDRLIKNSYFRHISITFCYLIHQYNNVGEGGIRTHGPLSGTLVFKTRAINHSATSPFSHTVV